jgi:hypothetical protein
MGRKVISVAGDVSVHVYDDKDLGTVKSVILSPGLGNSVALEDVPDYIRDDIESGSVPQLKIVSDAKADEIEHSVLSHEFIDSVTNPHFLEPGEEPAGDSTEQREPLGKPASSPEGLAGVVAPGGVFRSA